MRRLIIKLACALSWLASVMLSSPAARADSANFQICSTAGPRCNPYVASQGTFLRGTCMTGVRMGTGCQAKCGPDPASRAGGGGSANSAQASCLYCLLDGTAVGGGSTSGGSENVISDPSDCPDSGSDSGCSLRQLGSEKGIAGLLLALGIVALAAARRTPSP